MKKILIRLFLPIGLFIFLMIINLVFFNMSASKISEGEPISQPVPGNAAIMVIDIQEGTTGSESITGSYKDQSHDLIEKINSITEDAEEHEWPVIYIRNEVSNPLINLINSSLAKGSAGSELDSRLEIRSDYILTKNKKDAFSNPELDRILIEENVGSLVFVGLDAAYCVNNTIQAAQNRGYKISIIEEAVISETDSLKYVMLDQFRKTGVDITSQD